MKLENLINLAKRRNERIIAVSHDFTAYCSENDISFPNYDFSYHELLKIANKRKLKTSQEKMDFVLEILGTREKWIETMRNPLVLQKHHTLHWRGKNNRKVSAKRNQELNQNLIWYTSLTLPEDVKPQVDPFERYAAMWRLDSVSEKEYAYYI